MELSKEQVQKILDNAPQGADKKKVLDTLLAKGVTIKGIDPQVQQQAVQMKQVAQQVQGNQFDEANKPTTLLGKARNLATSIFGGGKLAEGAGVGLAAPKVQQQLGTAQQEGSDIALELTKRISEKKSLGEDTSRLENALKSLQISDVGLQDTQSDFTEALPTNKEVIGSSARLAGTLAGGSIAKAFAPATKATGVTQGILQGARTGALTGATEGAIQGAGIGLEQNKDTAGVVGSALTGSALGGITGGAIGGVVGGVSGRMNAPKQSPVDLVTPDTNELTPRQYKELLSMGRVTPKTATEPARVILSESEQQIVNKYPELITKDPIKTINNIATKVGELDDEVGKFLTEKNPIFNSGELKNKITESLKDIDDLSIDEQRLNTVKEKLVNRFAESLEKNDMVSLWKARKEFDRTIESAFKGAPSVQKEIKKAFRNSVQEFIADRTEDGVYKGFMSDMSNLIRVEDLVNLKAVKERGSSSLGKWIKDNPYKAKVIGYGSAAVAGSQFLPDFSD